MRRTMLTAALVVVGSVAAGSAWAVDLTQFLRQETFTDIKISPGGEYVAATVPMEDSTAIAVMRLADKQLVGSFRPPQKNHAYEFDWVSNERLLIGLAEKWGALDKPNPTGELYAIDANGNRGELLVGYRVESKGPGTRIQPKKVEAVAAFLADDLPGDERNVLVTVWPFAEDPFTRVERMDVVSGRRVRMASSPVRRGEFTTDGQGEVRFVHGSGSDNVNKLYYRERSGDSWKMINDEAVSTRIETAIGFSADGSLAYLQAEQAQGPDAIVSWNPQTGERAVVLRDEVVDPYRIIRRPGTHVPVGALFMGDTPRTRFFDEKSPEARLYRSLEAAFGGAVYITSSTRDGRVVLVETWSGTNPGDFYVYDTEARKADHLISRSDWIDIDRSATVRPVALKARDGLPLHGFLTVPSGSDGRNLPMVVMPHGGPFHVFDNGQYDRQTQILAAAGYAVLQVNFRGSGNYGRAHAQAGAQQWGAAMQDDVTDATRWAIAQGIADARRICIYGASYGAYAAMMGAAREQGLYQCAAGYVGVYDLPLMFARGDVQERDSGVTFLREWLGDPAKLGAVSPVNLATQIKVPVFLAAGGEDKRAPIQHTERMEAALKRAGTPVESLYYKTEGHGFYTLAHRTEYYDKLLAFLSRSLGGKTAQASAPAGKGKAP
ncbi:prolyl oligopeptidase family serine peptidase [Stenotrophomonas maltophilia]|uniref:alpha/beta hydrolase family protein n=1 Tax=Stenotrophomonas maltophilia TaxID=40324 RepID=UPI002096EE6A|nr:alpha/beta fold hydrolase [Stenotrophomonas maltophilia]MCO7398915.1 prolyl oligopeptidase family serine peptidase [Stenotrophomonas maltophilia]MCO7412534.1 prolyl oligopeptidase family serine peptidase [Stenotrophomonas maltophilia]HDS1651637.1 S9 family peptidase [Stenotrophomonas maltophilia]